MNLELNKATKRNTQCHWVSLAGVRMLFSYSTVVAFQAQGKSFCRRNDWGPTTGRHMNETGVRTWTEVADEKTFENMIDLALHDSIRNTWLAAIGVEPHYSLEEVTA